MESARYIGLIYVVDTSPLIWYLSRSARLSNAAKAILDNPGTNNRLAVPTMVLVEAWDLSRKQRREYVPVKNIIRTIKARSIVLEELTINVVNQLPDLWEDSRDMIVLATALDLEAQYGEVAIVSSDRKMRFCQSLVRCIW